MERVIPDIPHPEKDSTRLEQSFHLTHLQRGKKNLEGCKKIKIQIIENFISVTHSFLFYK